MNNLIIIGNGFDLAHGLKTSYSDFILHIFKKRSVDKKSYADLLNLSTDEFFTEKNLTIETLKKRSFYYNNKFFSVIMNQLRYFNWCDIEKLYYD